jgi:hypothetical protein
LPIDLDKKITTFLGSNDHGKSNILRAIQKLNEGEAITDEEANWDAADGEKWDRTKSPAISFLFSLTLSERKEWKLIVEQFLQDAAETLLQSYDGDDDDDDAGAAEEETEEEDPPSQAVTRPSAHAATKMPHSLATVKKGASTSKADEEDTDRDEEDLVEEKRRNDDNKSKHYQKVR